MTETLKDLIDLAKQRQNVRSGRALAQRAQEHGHQVDRTQLNDMAAGRYQRVPHESTVAALSWLAGVDRNRVRQAFGLADAGEPFVPHVDADLLSKEERDTVNDLIRVMVRGRRTTRRTPWEDRDDLPPEERERMMELAEEFPDGDVIKVPTRLRQGDVYNVHPDFVFNSDGVTIVLELKEDGAVPELALEKARSAMVREIQAFAERLDDGGIGEPQREVYLSGSFAARTGVSQGIAEREFLDGLDEGSQDPDDQKSDA